MPACWMTSVWPRATIPSTAANGSMPRSAPLLTLLEAKMALAANSKPHASVMVVRPLDGRSVGPNRLSRVIVPPATVATVGLWALKQALQSNARSRLPR